MTQEQAVSQNNTSTRKEMPNPEVRPRATRRTFTASYKLWVLEEADKCYKPGQIGALLRREGLYSSHLTTWRRQRKAGELSGLTPKQRGRKADESAAELSGLEQGECPFAEPVAAGGVDHRGSKKTLAGLEPGDDGTETGRALVIRQVEQLVPEVSVSRACASLGLPRSAWYRARQTSVKPEQPPESDRQSSRGLSAEEKEKVRQVLNSERFQDSTPRQVYGELLDEGVYLCHWRTMYRILAAHEEVRERRNQRRHPRHPKPELVATGPNQVWSWDITKLKGPVKWSYYYLYVVLDIYSRYVVGWLLAEGESAELAKQLLAETCVKEKVEAEHLSIHADNGSAMTSKTVALLLADLGVTKSHSRPRVSNDNPYSEAQFKTLKYRPDYPQQFDSLQDARSWASSFFQWYNHDHRHSGLGLMTPADRS